MSINATITTQPISATVSAGGTVSASVSAATVAVSGVSGGIGPQGPSGTAAPLSAVTDAAIASPTDGDVLRYQSSKWRNFKETDLTLDGGNF